MGLPRTGTTYLHRLLSLDPSVRAPLLWELAEPVPNVSGSAPLSEHATDRDNRMKALKRFFDYIHTPLFDNTMAHIHEIGYDLPEECILALRAELPFC